MTLKQTIVAIRLRVENLVELGATQWTKINVGSLVVFLHVKPKVGVFSRATLSVCLFVFQYSRVCLEFPDWGGYK